MKEKSKKFLLALARQTIVDYFQKGEKIEIGDHDLPDKELEERTASFVTLTKNGQLRGCVGSLIAKKKLYLDVINNSLLAAFADNRFSPVEKYEIPEIEIEISVLSKPLPYEYQNADELLEKILVGVHGVVLQKDFFQATYLPQVWDDLPDKIMFLESLSQKAGLPKDAWIDEETQIFFYTVEKFSDSEIDKKESNLSEQNIS